MQHIMLHYKGHTPSHYKGDSVAYVLFVHGHIMMHTEACFQPVIA